MLPVDLTQLIETVGYIGIFIIIFAETGLLIGFFLPGDSLLFTAGFIASQGILDIWILIVVCFVAAVTGDAVGYLFGSSVGRSLFAKPQSRFFNPDNLIRAEAFMEKHGGFSVIMARFVPFARTFVPVVAGVSAMRYRQFFVYNVIGAVIWAVGLPLAGYYLGSRIPSIDHYLIPAILIILVIASIPSGIHLWKEHGHKVRSRSPAPSDKPGESID